MDEEFTGKKLIALVIENEGAVGGMQAGLTPLGQAVTQLCEEAARKDKERRENER